MIWHMFIICTYICTIKQRQHTQCFDFVRTSPHSSHIFDSKLNLVQLPFFLPLPFSPLTFILEDYLPNIDREDCISLCVSLTHKQSGICRFYAALCLCKQNGFHESLARQKNRDPEDKARPRAQNKIGFKLKGPVDH